MPATDAPAAESDVARALVDLDALTDNYRRLTAQVAPALVAPAVKADAYGLGMAAVAGALWRVGARSFFVAWSSEGAALRRLLPTAEIFVLNGLEPGSSALYRDHHLTPCLNSLAEIDEWLAATPDARPPAALHIDTGMARLGLGADEVTRLAQDRAKLTALDLTLAMTHLARGDEPAASMNETQQLAFLAALEQLGLGGRKRISLAASGGSFLGAAFHGGLVRPGAALYGLVPQEGMANPMRPVLRLQAKILQVRFVDAGTPVGYGSTRLTSRPSRLVTVAAGYADGCFRSLGNRAHAYLGSAKLPVMGRVSMDLLTLDATDAPSPSVERGAYVDLIGPHLSVDDLAGLAGTIGYEVLTALGKRIPRRYRGQMARELGLAS